jgi:hypothetical protein
MTFKAVPTRMAIREPDSDGPIFRGWTWGLAVHDDQGQIIVGPQGGVSGSRRVIEGLADEINEAYANACRASDIEARCEARTALARLTRSAGDSTPFYRH